MHLRRPPADVLPMSVDSHEALQRTIDVGRIMLAADTLGAAQTMLDKAVAYAKERRQFIEEACRGDALYDQMKDDRLIP